MPRVTIWIRQEDWDKWQAIDDKPAWLHEHLDMPKVTKDGYRSEHFYAVPVDEPTVEPYEGEA